MLNNHVFGEQDIQFETSNYPEANYLNDFVSIRLPIFMIHGNHDDPVGIEYLSNIDFLNTTKQINYFGKIRNMERIEVEPILLTKG